MERNASSLSLSALALLVGAPLQAQWSTASLSQARGDTTAVSVGDLALFAGGRQANTLYDVVDIYDASTDSWTTSSLSVPMTNMAGASIGKYALFGGGSITIALGSDVVDIFDTQAETWSMAELSEPRGAASAVRVGNKVLFAGGFHAGALSDVVDIYDADLGAPDDPLAWSTASLSEARGFPSAAAAGHLAVFAGGQGIGTTSDAVDIYDSLTGQWTTATLSVARSAGRDGAVAVGSKVYIAGGLLNQAGDVTDAIDVFDGDSGVWSTSTLPAARAALGSAVLGNIALFAGGAEEGVGSTRVDMLNVGTGEWTSSNPLSEARWNLVGTAAGGKAIFAGGFTPGAASAVVDIYEPVGLNYCAAGPNSTGGAASISVTGSHSVAANDLVLRAAPVPDQFGIFFYGPLQVQQAFGNGYLCVGGGASGLARLSIEQGAGGVITHALDNTAAPFSAVQILPGSTWNFSTWFRDPLGGGAFFDLSDAISIDFTL